MTVSSELVTEGLGPFDSLVKLGSGTYGTTFRARRGTDEFALKVIHFPELPHYLWEREIGALEIVEHPNVVQFRDRSSFKVGNVDYPYLECEFVDGGTVADSIATGHRPSSPEILRGFLTGLLAGVQEIHELGIIHRDIKPANVALRNGDWGEPVLLDFGLAKVLNMSSHTVYPASIGTPNYMSPEQLEGKPARARSDLFSVGVVTFEAGTGRHPFLEPGGPTTVNLVLERIGCGPPDPREFSDWWSDSLALVVRRFLSFHGHARLGIERALIDLEEEG